MGDLEQTTVEEVQRTGLPPRTILQITACCFSFVSLLLLIVALVSDYWTVDSEGTRTGLWRICHAEKCMSYGMEAHAHEHAARAFLSLGMIFGTTSFFCLCASFFYTHATSVSIQRFSSKASFLAGVCAMLAMSKFTIMYKRQFSHLESWFGWSHSTGWASFPLFLITAGLAYKTISSPTET
ncbi:peripheral myelin protein 22-like [Heteronotia binoei]|uniref:peripheral myelin protein 22-like n=1 Tax=Heteronotia binoei TaxID=13085 RepID=UPI00292EADEB|nr:peripheral myelin protein 22-like [Heteronotia binoei]